MKNIEKVVAGVDFTGQGMDGVRWVARHLEPESIVLVHALHLPNPPSFLAGLWGDDEQISVSAHAGATERLEDLAERLGQETGLDVEARVRTGPPGDQIARVADSVDADLVVVGPHSTRRGRWERLGSTAERVIHQVRVPTLLTTGRLGDPERILAAIDESAVSAGLLSWLKALSEHLEAEATLLHVIDNTLEMSYRAILSPNVPGREVELERKASAWLETRLAEVGFDGAEPKVALGEPAIEILAAVERLNADLLLMGTHGAGTATRLLMGGVTRMVVRSIHCPLLLLPTPD